MASRTRKRGGEHLAKEASESAPASAVSTVQEAPHEAAAADHAGGESLPAALGARPTSQPLDAEGRPPSEERQFPTPPDNRLALRQPDSQPSSAGTSPASRASYGSALSETVLLREGLSIAEIRAMGFDSVLAVAMHAAGVRSCDIHSMAPRSAIECLGSRRTALFGRLSLSVMDAVAAAVSRKSQARMEAASSSRELVIRPPPQPAATAQPAPELTSSFEIERAEVRKQMRLLLAVCPSGTDERALRFRPNEWQAIPPARRETLITSLFGSFSAGQLSSTRRALLRLERWLENNGFAEACNGFSCSPGMLGWWLQDEQLASRSLATTGALSVPQALLAALRFAQTRLRFDLPCDDLNLKAIAAPPARPPTPALSATAAFLYHFVSLCAHAKAVVAYYAAGFVLMCIAVLRVRDAQRASLRIAGDTIAGMCFTSKHPKRRTPLPMPFFAPISSGPTGDTWVSPLRGCSTSADYLFPRVTRPRGSSIDHPEAAFMPGPAKSAEVIRDMRYLLQLPPLSLTAAEAALYSGHSPRHLIPSLARLLGFPIEDRKEVARWAAMREKRAERGAMPNLYAQEVESPRVLEILSRILSSLDHLVKSLGGPFGAGLPNMKGWEELSAALRTHAIPSEELARIASIDPEASSSESEEEPWETNVEV